MYQMPSTMDKVGAVIDTVKIAVDIVGMLADTAVKILDAVDSMQKDDAASGGGTDGYDDRK